MTGEQPDDRKSFPQVRVAASQPARVARSRTWMGGATNLSAVGRNCRPTCSFSIRSDRRVFFDQTDPAGTASAQHGPAARSESPQKGREA